MNIIDALNKSSSLAELHKLCELPEPYDDRGYFFVYYAEADYKSALNDVVQFIDGGMRIYYDRRMEYGASWQSDYLSKSKSLRCRCVVFYLSENSFFDGTFKKLCKIVYDNNIPYVSVNISGEYGIQSGEQMIERFPDRITEEQKKIYAKLFSNEITYIPDSFSVDEKRASLEKAYSKPIFSFSVNGDYAVVDRVRDITEEEIVVPWSVLIGDEEYVVKEIAPAAFAGCENLRKISFPDSIEYVGVAREGMLGKMFARTFADCKCLTELVFPNSLKQFGAGNLTGCSALKRLVFGKKTEFIADASSVFMLFNTDKVSLDGDEQSQESVLEEIKLPESVKKTKEGNYVACIDGKWCELYVPEAENVWGYADWAIEKEVYVDAHDDPSYLSGSEEIESVIFDPEWRYGNIYNCFAGCVNLKRVVFPKRCYMLSGTFEGCTSLEEVELPQTLMRIDDDTFSGCMGLKEIALPRSVTHIANAAFYGCENLKVLVIENTDCKKLLKGGFKLERQKCKTFWEKVAFFFAMLKVPFTLLRHLPSFIEIIKQPAFYVNTGICEIYTKSKVKIKYFKLCESDRLGYYKYVRR